jgi:phenylpropionate dioxygenase-like ring-hydroxylating dioxygenase large terminal subunit
MAEAKATPTIVHGAAPVEPLPITPERYLSPTYMQREADNLWPRMWLFACLERDVANVGDFSVFNLGRESIIISRTQEGNIAAFYNACQHRGAKVATEDRGCVAKFVCPYHGWSYRLDGKLVVVPDNNRFCGGVDRNERSMQQVQVDTFAGLVWICMDNNAAPLREYLGMVGDRIAPFHMENMTLVGDQTVRLDCNWKAVYDNFGELYHGEHIHPQHAMLFDCPTAQVELFEN